MSTATTIQKPSLIPVKNEFSDLVEGYHRNGFVNGGPLLDSVEVDVLKRELDRVVAEHQTPGVPHPYMITNTTASAKTALWQIVNIWQASAAFAAILRKPRLVAQLSAISGGKELRLWHDQIQYKPAGNGGVNWWHQDCPYWAPLTPADELFSAWIALDDADVDNGCMSMVPGSHGWGNAIKYLEGQTDYDHLPAEYNGNKVSQVHIPVRAGHVHFHHSYTWHGSHANTSGRPRRAIAIHVMTDRVRRQEGKHPLSPDISVAIGEPVKGPLFPIIALAAR